MLPITCTQNSQIMTLLVKFEKEIHIRLGKYIRNFCVFIETSQNFKNIYTFFMQSKYVVDKFYTLYDQILYYSKTKLSLVSRYS